MAVPFHVPASRARRFRFLHILDNTLLSAFGITACPAGVERHLAVVLTCVSLMPNAMGHLFTYLPATGDSSVEMGMENLCPFYNVVVTEL